MIEVLPAILEKEWNAVEKKAKVIAAFAQRVHFDVMDGDFVNNTTFSDASRIATLPLQVEAHLMINRPELHLLQWNVENVFRIIVHAEAAQNLGMAVDMIKRMGKEAAISINPGTQVHELDGIFDRVDMVQVMGVDPGHSGQKFQADVLEKVKELRAIAPGLNISVDGGVNGYTLKRIVNAGANTVVANSYLFSQPDPAATYKEMQSAEPSQN